MLTPKQLAHIPDPIMALVADLEDSIIRDISRRITKADYLTPTAEWQLYKASVLRKSSAEVMKKIAKYTGKSQREIKKIMTDACMEAIHTDAEIHRKAGKDVEPFLRSVALSNTIKAGIKTANGLMSNFTRTTAITARRTLTQALDRAYLEVNSGAFTYQEAITRAVSSLGTEGLKVVKYASGRTDQMDVAVRRAVLTSVSQTAGTLQLQMAEEMDSDLVEVTEHLGARPSHAEWQGKIYSISGKSKKYPKLSEATGYGTGAGLKGWNCRHDFYPWYEGISVFEDGKVDPKENAKEYEESQRQRAFERSIRKSKRRLTALDESIKNTDDAVLKEKLQRKFDRSAITLKNQETKMKEWLRLTGRTADNARLQVSGFNRSVSGKAVWRAKNLEIDKIMKNAIMNSTEQPLLSDPSEIYKKAKELSALPQFSGVTNKTKVKSLIDELFGYNKLPTVLSEHDFNLLSMRNKVYYRGLSDGTLKAEKYAKALKYGEIYYGKHAYGVGIYFSPDYNSAKTYAKANGVIVDGICTNNAKVITYQELRKLNDKIRMLPEYVLSSDANRFITELGALATISGYDIIDLNGVNNLKHKIIVNRTKMIFKE